MAVAADPRIGTELAGYRIEALLGRGGMSDVYLAEDLRLKRKVALKLLAADLASDVSFRERFLRESQLAASLDHPNVIPIYAAGEAEGLLYIAMRYVEGSDLKMVLAGEGRLEPPRTLAVFDQVADALDTAHRRGLVHRDVKPGNILIAAQGEREHVYLSDFGITKQTGDARSLTESGQFLGTADYMAPEQIEGGEIDGRADVYSLGCVLYECLAGEAPFASDSKVGLLFAHLQKPPPPLSQHRPELSSAIDAVVAKAMAKQPDDRYASCRELAGAARAVLEASASGALPSPLDSPAPPLVGRKEELAWLRREWSSARAGSGALLVLSGPRGIGKTRLVAELAREVSSEGAAVRYASCVGSDGTAATTLAGAVSADGPALSVLEDLDAADATVLEALDSVAGELADKPLLVVATCRRADAQPALESLVGRVVAADGLRELAPLTAAEASEIAVLYVGDLAESFPVEMALEATGGVPLRLHELASEWARAEASRRLGSVAAHAAAERSSLRDAEAAVADKVVGLQLVQERARLYVPEPRGGADGRDVCPFKGLASFETADADYFFGRERLVAELIARLVGAGCLGIVGPSGSGKSSVLRAGLLPALAAGVLPGSERWRQVLIRPGEHPLAELARGLRSDTEDPLASTLGALSPGERLLLAVDQFEELFTASSSEEEQEAFATALVAAASDPEERAVVLVAARADFYGRCAEYPALAELLGANHVLVGPMQAAELRRAIELPAGRVGLEVEPELVQALVADVEHEPGGLPLLSTSLLELWQKRTGNALELATYQNSGGVHGAVARLAEEAYGRLSEAERPLARSILLRLAGEGEGDAVVRRRAPLTEFDTERNEQAGRVLAALTERRLVTVSEGTVEVAHEALLREWPRLRQWIEEDSQGRSLRRHITEAATEWQEADRDEGTLYRGARLAAALDWTADHEHELNQLERTFITQSREASEQETRRVRRTNRRLRGLLIGVAVLLAAAIAGGIFAVVQRGQARDAADKAQASATQARSAETAQLAQRLGAQALVEDDLDRSLLLARQAVTIDDSPETRAYLLAALQRSPAAVGISPRGGAFGPLALSPDGRRLAVRDFGGGGLFFLDAQSLEPVSDVPQVGRLPSGLAYSPDGRTLAILDRYAVAHLALVDAASGVIQGEEYSSIGDTGRVAYSPDGRLLATAEAPQKPDGSADWLVVIRDAATGEQTGTPLETGAAALDFAFMPDGRSVLTSNEGEGLALVGWNLETRRPVREFEGTGGTIAVSPDGSTVAVGREDGTVALLDLGSRTERGTAGGHGAAVTSVTFSPDGTILASTSDDGTAIVWDVASGAPRETLRGHALSVQTAVFSGDGKTLYTASDDGTAIAWDVAGDRRVGQAFNEEPTPDGTRPARFTLDGKQIAVGLHGTGIGLRDAHDLEPVGATLEPTGGQVVALAVSGDGKTLVAVTVNGKATVWDVESRSLLGGPWVVNPTRYQPVVNVSPDGATIAVAGLGGVELWDAGTAASLGRLTDGPSTDVAFDATGELVAFGMSSLEGLKSGEAEVWDVARNARITTVKADRDEVSAVALSPDGNILATKGWESIVRLWDTRTGALILEFDELRTEGSPRLYLSPDGRRLAVAGGDGTVTLWDVETGTLEAKLDGRVPGSSLGRLDTDIDFSPDGKRLLMTMADGRLIVWDVDPESWKRRACDVANRTLTQREWEEFLPDRPYEPACTQG